MGHAAPFAFDLDYRAGQGIERMRVGTPPVIALAALDAALDAWDGVVDGRRARRLDRALRPLHRRGRGALPGAGAGHARATASQRGSQVSFRHPEGYAIMQALIARGVIGDFRAPDNIRFGFTPLYIGEAEVRGAVEILADIMANRLWDRPEYRRRAAVT